MGSLKVLCSTQFQMALFNPTLQRSSPAWLIFPRNFYRSAGYFCPVFRGSEQKHLVSFQTREQGGVFAEQTPGRGCGPNLGEVVCSLLWHHRGLSGAFYHRYYCVWSRKCGFYNIHWTWILCDAAPTSSIRPSHRNIKKKKKYRPEGRLAICSNQLSVVLCQTKHLHSSLQPPVVPLLTHWS